jgi:hypothetical protein
VTIVIRPNEAGRQISSKSKSRARTKRSSGSGTGSGQGNGVGYGSGSGTGIGSGNVPPPPPLPRPPQPKPVVPNTPEQLRETQLKGKLHSWLYTILDRLAKGDAKPTPNEVMFVRDGKADVQIELSARSPAIIEKLKAAGFEIVAEKGKTIIAGRIALGKLAALADIEEVKLILPKI